MNANGKTYPSTTRTARLYIDRGKRVKSFSSDITTQLSASSRTTQNESVATTSCTAASMIEPPSTVDMTRRTMVTDQSKCTIALANPETTSATKNSSGQIWPGCEITWNSGSSGRTRKRSKRPSCTWYGMSPTVKNSVLLSVWPTIHNA